MVPPSRVNTTRIVVAPTVRPSGDEGYAFDPKTGSKLDLVGTLSREAVHALLQFSPPMEYVTIHGVTVDGMKITLGRAVQSGSRLRASSR